MIRAMADPSRRKVLRVLSQRPLSAGQIADHFDFTKPTLSRHLKVLRQADLVVTERHGTRIEYSRIGSVSEMENRRIAMSDKDRGNGLLAGSVWIFALLTTVSIGVSRHGDEPGQAVVPSFCDVKGASRWRD